MTSLEELEALLAAPVTETSEASSSLPTHTEDAPRRYTDLGNAELFARQHGADLRWVPDWGAWLRFDGTRWMRAPSESMIPLAAETIRSLYALAADRDMDPEERGKLIKHALASETAGRLEAMIRVARGLLVASSADFDCDAFALNVANGTIDLRTGGLHPHARADLITMMAPVAYDPSALAPMWEAFLARVLPNAELRGFVQRFSGYCLTGDVGEQVLAFWFGRGANGKSTAIEVLLSILGDYAKTAAPDLLLAKNSEAHPTEQADLKGARLVVAQEVEAGRQWAEKTIKQLTGGDTIKARFMRADFFAFKPTHKLLVAANHKPRVRGTEEAIWRRIRLVPFDVTIPREDRDPDLVRKLRVESPGILAWAVRGCLDWQRDRLGVPAAVGDATAAYRDEQDHLGRFVEDACDLDPGAFCATTSLYAAYTSWCTRSGDKPWSREAFREGLLEHAAWHLAEHRSKAVRGIKGVRIRARAPTVTLTDLAGDAGDAGDAGSRLISHEGPILAINREIDQPASPASPTRE